MQKEINCLYGNCEPQNAGILFVYNGWYVIEGSVNINRTHENLTDGVNVEAVEDYDIITSTHPINSLNELIKLIDS